MATQARGRRQKGALVSRLTKLFSRKASPEELAAEYEAQNTSIYLGDVEDDASSLARRTAPAPLSSLTTQKAEADGPCPAQRGAAVGPRPGAPALDRQPSLPGCVSEIQPDGTPVRADRPARCEARRQEQGIAEVDGGAQHQHASPLHNSCEAAEARLRQPRWSHHLLSGAALEPEPAAAPAAAAVPALRLDTLEQPAHAAGPPGACPDVLDSAELLDSWEDAMFGPAGGEPAAAEADSKKRPVSLLNTGSSGGRMSSHGSMHLHKMAAACRSPAKQHRDAAWASGARSRQFAAGPTDAGAPQLELRQAPWGRPGSSGGGGGAPLVPQLRLATAAAADGSSAAGLARGANPAALRSLQLPLPRAADEHQTQHPRQQRRDARRRQEAAAGHALPGRLPALQPLQDVTAHVNARSAPDAEAWHRADRPARKSADFEPLVAARLAEYAARGAGVPAETSPARRRLRLDRAGGGERERGPRRVRFTDDPPGLDGLRKAREELHSTEAALAAMRTSDKAAYPAERAYRFGSEVDDEEALVQAMAMAGELPLDSAEPTGPMQSPSRFLQSAEEPSPLRDASPEGGLQDWDERVSMQLSFARTLAAPQPPHGKAADAKLQRVSCGLQPAARPPWAERPPFPPPPPARELPWRPRSPALPPHQAAHSSTGMLRQAAAAKTEPWALAPPLRQAQRGFVPARAAVLAAEARAAPPLSSSKTGPLWTAPAGDWEASTMTSRMTEAREPGCHPVSVPGSPGSSLRGHALSHVTCSPGRQSWPQWRAAPGQEPWAPEMRAVAEAPEPPLASLAEMAALSFRPSPRPRAPQATQLTQATLQNRALLDTVGCDVDLALLRSMWPPGRAPSPAAVGAVPEAEPWETPVEERLAGLRALQSTPSDYWFSRRPARVPQFA